MDCGTGHERHVHMVREIKWTGVDGMTIVFACGAVMGEGDGIFGKERGKLVSNDDRQTGMIKGDSDSSGADSHDGAAPFGTRSSKVAPRL